VISATSFNASHAPRCVACQGVRSHPVPVGVLHLLSSGSPAPGLTGWRFPGVEYPVNLARFRHTTPEGLMDHGEQARIVAFSQTVLAQSAALHALSSEVCQQSRDVVDQTKIAVARSRAERARNRLRCARVIAPAA